MPSMPYRNPRTEGKRHAMRGSGLLTHTSKTRLDHITGAAGSESEKKALMTSYELTKGGRLLWEPQGHEVPALGTNGTGAIKKGMKNYYNEMINLRPDSLEHLQKVHTYISSELFARGDRIKALQGKGGSSWEATFPKDPRLRKVVEEHLTAERAVLDELHAELGSRISELKKKTGG